MINPRTLSLPCGSCRWVREINIVAVGGCHNPNIDFMELRIAKVTPKKEGNVNAFVEMEWNKWVKKNGYNHKTKKYAFAAYANKKIVGYVSLRINGGTAYLSQLIVSDSVRGHGVGTSLLKKFESYAKLNKCHLAYLETHEKNTAALSLYKHNGYNIIATMTNNRFHFTWYILSKRLKVAQ
jgi:ribosomal protein S18 acetylase RimI-like enzyme